MKRFTFVFSLYTLLGIVTLWSLISQINQVVPNGTTTDYQHFIWNYWWMEHALKAGVSPWFSDFVLYPNIHNLSLHTMTPIWFPAWLMLEPIIGQIAWVNLIILASFSINATAMYYWLKSYTTYPTAFIGGVIFTFHPYIIWSASDTHLNVIALWWIPVSLILWRSIAQHPRWWKTILMGLVLWGCVLTDLQYALFLPFTLGIYGIWTLIQSRRKLHLIGQGIVAIIILAGLMLLYPLPQITQIDTSNPYIYPPASLNTIRDWAIPFDALLGLSDDPKRTFGILMPIIMWVGILEYAIKRKPDYKLLWLIAALPAVLLMLGAQNNKMPYWYLHEALHGQYRTPERFVIPAIFSLVTFAAAVYQIPTRRWWVAGIITPLLLFDFGAFKPFPVETIRDFPIYHSIGADARDYVIMDLPVGVHYGWTGMGEGRYSQYYATIHQKRVINGFLARMRFPDYAYYTDSEMFRWLAYPADDEHQYTIVDEFNQHVTEYPIGYVFAHRYWMTTDQQNLLIGWMNMRDGFCPPQLSDDAALIWWKHESLACEATEPTTIIDIGAATDWLSISEGWSWQEDIGGTSARWASESAMLRVDLLADVRYEVTFSALAFNHPRNLSIGDQTITITSDGWHDYTIIIDGTDRLILQHDSADSPQDLGLSGDTRQLSIAYSMVSVRQLGD